MKNLIGYEWKEASDGNKIEVVNPATSELIDTVPNVTEEDVNKAVEVAEIEQKKWAEVPIHERADKLYKFVDLIEENKERLAQLLTAETGKPIKEARGEIANVRIGVRAFIERAKHLYGESIPAGQEAGQEKTIYGSDQKPFRAQTRYGNGADPSGQPDGAASFNGVQTGRFRIRQFRSAENPQFVG